MDVARSRDGTRIAFEAGGTGPALVAVTGALSDRASARALLSYLEERFTVVAYDRRGRGDSGDTPPYAVDREIEDLAAILDAVGGQAFVYGHSSGAILSLRAAARGIPIRRLAAHEPPFILAGARPLPGADISARITAHATAGEREGALRLFLREAVGQPEAVVEAVVTGQGRARALAMAHTTAYDCAVADTFEMPTALLAAVRTPTLVVAGGASFPWIVQTATAVAKAIPGATLRVLEGQTHGATPAALGPALTEFFVA